MNTDNILFKFDAGKIIAKLHLGACQTHDKLLFFNTGIINNEEIPPDKCNNSKINFDLKNKNGLYEIGVIITDEMTYNITEPINIDSSEDNSVTDTSSKDESSKDTSSKDESSEGESMDSEYIVQKFYDFDDTDNVTDNDNLNKNIKDRDEFLNKQKTIALSYLKDYMTEFGGIDEANKIQLEDIVVIQLSEKFSDPYKIKKYPKYIIPSLDKKELSNKKYIEKFLDNIKNKKVEFNNLCFKIGYSLKI